MARLLAFICPVVHSGRLSMRLHSRPEKNRRFPKHYHRRSEILLIVAIGMVLFSSSSVRADTHRDLGEKMYLHSGWTLQSSCQFSATGEQISTVGFKPEGWHSTEVPSTVVAALVADKTYSDPYFGK